MQGLQQSDILLVDDSSEVAELTKFAILRKKLTEKWTWFNDPERASDFLFHHEYTARRDLHPFLILLDLNMPRLSGHDLLRMLKGNKATSHIPVVMFSTSTDREDIRKSYELGANGHVTSPWSIVPVPCGPCETARSSVCGSTSTGKRPSKLSGCASRG